jgi:hypothetical protein
MTASALRLNRPLNLGDRLYYTRTAAKHARAEQMWVRSARGGSVTAYLRSRSGRKLFFSLWRLSDMSLSVESGFDPRAWR